ncbi:OmpA family protein [Alkalihalobacterium chitinilyticum]|uniref:OmpA family protein n=1 Tax=Alkalihalobacterium chitinilyticum TaxID=2980103 RepID=A0ABT5VJ64_9BACI|nr:OmpA family protein [Alkalihalobacterium chitinilyticum]MDE5414284.1 OmpA family protein [Alkalihalobacterium chitinilyticum]
MISKAAFNILGLLLLISLMVSCSNDNTVNQEDESENTHIQEVDLETSNNNTQKFTSDVTIENNVQSQVYLSQVPRSRVIVREIQLSQVEKEILDTLTEFEAVVEEQLTTLTLPDNILFDFGSHQLRDEANEVIEQLVQVIEASEGEVHIAGHTDHIGEASFNKQLSEDRAQSVLQAFVNKGLDESRFVAEGFGEEKPIVSNTRPDGSDYEEGRQKNRRVEITVQGLFQE